MPKSPAKKRTAATPLPKKPAAADTRACAASPGERLVKLALKRPEFRQRLAAFETSGSLVLDHVSAPAQGFAAALLARHLGTAKPKTALWVLCTDARHQDQLLADLAVWNVPALAFPKITHAAGDDALPDPDVQAERLTALTRLRHATPGEPRVIVMMASSLDESVPSAVDLDKHRRQFKVGQQLKLEAFVDELDQTGYEHVPQVTERGQFAKRGGILDFYSWQADEPLRLEVFDTELESIRSFDIHGQGSVRKMDHVSVIVHLPEETSSAFTVRDYLRAGDCPLWMEPNLKGFILQPGQAVITTGALGSDAEDFSTAIYENPMGVFDASDFVLHEARRKSFHMQVADWHQAGWKTVIFLHNEAEQERFLELLQPDVQPMIEIALGLLYRGFIIPSAKLAVLSGAELFGRHQVPRRIRGSKLEEAQSLRQVRDLIRELKPGDLVVHMEYGIGRFVGIEVRGEGSYKEEVMAIGYAEQAKVFVPTSEAHLVSRYVGVGGKTPSLNRIGDARWQATKKKAERAVEEFAARMLQVAAERQTVQSKPHPEDGKWQTEFEGSFLYRETPDQLRSVEEIKLDMESPRPMDRLLCADVGFGKTEVALRAAFKCVMGGRQVAILVPTTVLASQHWQNIRERMSEFPVTVEMLCRLTPPDKEKEILQGMKDGSVDIVIGTHRLISKDIKFKDLGLAVVDEEQRFGVRHKERFKELFRFIDVLTLSATPIPRTLYLALMGMRDMSTIETPPPNKQAVQTIVCQFDERVIRDAVNAELDRGGQIFFLHNRVSDIEHVAAKIKLLCPRARVLTGHGQMEGEQLEGVMHRFIDGKADVLVCTTIIESGVDIPNANTIIIDRADRFGLADLYQLRGRVGRAGQRAFAYLMLPRDFVSGGDARKRVNAMKQYSALGSGFKIAMRDLEIRGAGNLLGTEQSGHIAAVGFDMYCQMLKVSVNKLKGRRTTRPVEVNLRIDFLCLSETAMAKSLPDTQPAFIPTSLIDEPMMRIQTYRGLSETMNRKELDDLERQWRDQFGRLDLAMQNLLTTTAIRLAAAHVGISEVEIRDRKLMLKRNNAYVHLNGKFPRLSAKDTQSQLLEALKMLREL
jgi:transcription-repair coupling factor (superfamily II helicase)